MEVLSRLIKTPSVWLAAACLLFTAGALNAQGLNPVNTGVTAASASFSWANDGSSYNAALSDTNNFSTYVYSAVLTGAATFYTGLSSNTTYYFRIKRTTAPNGSYEPATAVTPASGPSGVYFISEAFRSYLMTGGLIRIGWGTNNNATDTVYEVDYASDNAFTDAVATSRGYPPVDIGGLAANTTYYFRVRAVDRAGAPTAYSAPASTATLALGLNNIANAVYETSGIVSWDPVSNPLTSALSSEGSRLSLSLSPGMAPTLFPDWNTTDPDIGSKVLSGLDPNTTYYYTVGSLNPYGVMNSDYTRSFTTLSVRPQNLKFTAAIGAQTAVLGWTALPAAPPSASADGYRLEASSVNFTAGNAYLSTATGDILNNTLTIDGLDANTTYYFRAASLNKNYDPNYSLTLSSITLSAPLSAGLLATVAAPRAITVNLISPLPSFPQRSTCEGYLLEASSRPFGSGSVIYSSASGSNLTGSLTLSGLRPNTAYNLRIASLNWANTPNYSALPSALTPVGQPLVSAPLSGIWQSSASVSFSAVASDGYVLEASTVNYFIPLAGSSVTANASVPGLAVTGLDENTHYYFRAGALYNGATVYTLTTPDQRYTLPLPLTSPAIAAVFHTSATVSWTHLPALSQKTGAVSYRLEASASPDFAGQAYTAETSDLFSGSQTVQNLLPNTSYYFRAGTVNADGAKNFVYTPSTPTLANPAIQTLFSDFAPGRLSVNWQANSNPPDTVYFVRFSSHSDYSSAVFSSATVNTSATFTGLSPNTTYYPEMTVFNRLNVPEGPSAFNPRATLAYNPLFAAFSELGVSSITLNWVANGNLTGDTEYKAEISSSPVFAPPVLSAVTMAASHTFYGLVSNATYYLQVSALNRTGDATLPTSLGQALTLPATAYVLSSADTFTGLMTDGFTLNWADNGNSPYTIYNIEISTYDTGISASDNLAAWARSASASVNALSCSFKDLTLGATYWARIQAQGQTGIDAYSVFTSTVTTLRSNQAGALTTRGTTITLQASYGLISVFIPPGALGGSSRITIEPEDSFMPPVSAAAVLRPTGIGLSVTRYPEVLVLNPVTITLPYRRLPPGIDPARLVLALYDEDAAVWVPLPSVSDTAGHKVTAQTWHLSTFQLMEAYMPASLAGARIYPNPYMPSSVADVMHFTNLPPYAKIKIYTFLGELVKEFSADSNGMAYWDGRNSGGQKTASGVYIALLKSRDKSSSRMMKVVIER